MLGLKSQPAGWFIFQLLLLLERIPSPGLPTPEPVLSIPHKHSEIVQQDMVVPRHHGNNSFAVLIRTQTALKALAPFADKCRRLPSPF
jgi:hypothetical protein